MIVYFALISSRQLLNASSLLVEVVDDYNFSKTSFGAEYISPTTVYRTESNLIHTVGEFLTV